MRGGVVLWKERRRNLRSHGECLHYIARCHAHSGGHWWPFFSHFSHTGTFPTAFKEARVTPLLKKPTLNNSLTDSYRPVSLLPFIAKTFERVVLNQLSSFLLKHNLLDVNQSGFRRGHSTETALLSVTEALRIAKANSKSSVLILLDLSAAFDTVNHQIPLTTLSSLVITGIPLRCFESYLNGRSFKVAWGGEVSTEHQLVTGLPQGSVLGPLFFSTYTKTLGPIIQAHGFSYHCYADDTQLYLSFRPDDPTVAARISDCLMDISAWIKEHHLQLNLAKTELLVFPATPNLQHDFTIHNQVRSEILVSFSMTSWLSKTTLQKLLNLAGLHYTTSERSGPSLHSTLHNFLSRPLSFIGWTTAMLF